MCVDWGGGAVGSYNINRWWYTLVHCNSEYTCFFVFYHCSWLWRQWSLPVVFSSPAPAQTQLTDWLCVCLDLEPECPLIILFLPGIQQNTVLMMLETDGHRTGPRTAILALIFMLFLLHCTVPADYCMWLKWSCYSLVIFRNLQTSFRRSQDGRCQSASPRVARSLQRRQLEGGRQNTVSSSPLQGTRTPTDR